MSTFSFVSKSRVFSGILNKCQHSSTALKTDMKFNVYIPEYTSPSSSSSSATSSNTKKFPVLYWLSGLTCTEDNFAQKCTVAFKYAYEKQIAIVIPDTSPRGHPHIEGEDESWDFGLGASFYVNATVDKYKEHYNMYDYILKELPRVVEENLPIDNQRKGIFGHSMGGYGALMFYLRNPSLYASVSAFAPICNPIECDWGKKAFSGFLGSDENGKVEWAKYDPTMLVKAYNGKKVNILIDQGTADQFYSGDKKQLLPDNFQAACSGNKQYVDLTLRMQEGYDHSYYFMSTFIGDHIAHHAKYLNASQSPS